jgi:hypothetical protein
MGFAAWPTGRRKGAGDPEADPEVEADGVCAWRAGAGGTGAATGNGAGVAGAGAGRDVEKRS